MMPGREEKIEGNRRRKGRDWQSQNIEKHGQRREEKKKGRKEVGKEGRKEKKTEVNALSGPTKSFVPMPWEGRKMGKLTLSQRN